MRQYITNCGFWCLAGSVLVAMLAAGCGETSEDLPKEGDNRTPVPAERAQSLKGRCNPPCGPHEVCQFIANPDLPTELTPTCVCDAGYVLENGTCQVACRASDSGSTPAPCAADRSATDDATCDGVDEDCSEPPTITARDTVAPTLSLNVADQVSTQASLLRISGQAADAGVGLFAVTATVDTSPGEALSVALSPSGAFSVEVPLLTGANTLTVTVLDQAGNEAKHSTVITVTLPTLPELRITEPASGAVLYTETVDIRGVARTSSPPGQLRIGIGSQTVFPSGGDGLYNFELLDVPLTMGSNVLTVRAETPEGTTASQVVVRRESGASGGPTAPIIELNVNKSDVYASSDTFTVSGVVRSDSPLVSITVNGDALTFDSIGKVASFSSERSFAAAGALVVPIVVEAVAENGGRVTARYTMHKDDQPPVLVVDRLQEMPATNSMLATPYPLEGTVSDPNLSGLVVNQQSIGALPGANPEEWAFDVAVPLTRGAPLFLSVQAWDLASNVTSRVYQLSYDASVDLEIVEPKSGAVIYAQNVTSQSVEVRVSAPGLSESDAVVARLDGGADVVLSRSGAVASGALTVAVDGASHNIAVEARAKDGAVLASGMVSVKVADAESVPLSVSRFEPENQAKGAEPVTSLALYFNRPIDPAKLVLDVRQTVHGKRYEIPEAADLTRQSDLKLVDVNKDREPVIGGVSVLPGHTMVAFYAQNGFEYGATVLVTATYDGKDVGRATFEVRPLPTLVQGFLLDENMRPLIDVEVLVPDLGLFAKTDVEGGYQFGFAEPVENTIPPGNYRMVINPGQRAPRYMTVERWLSVEGERFNQAGMVRLPYLNPQEPYRFVASGEPKVLLAKGMLELDLGSATLRFEDGAQSGELSARAVMPVTVPFNAAPGATPTLSFLLSPAGVSVDGEVGVTIRLPAVDKTFEYLENMPDWMVLIGLDDALLELVPVGVVKLDRVNGVLESQGEVRLERMDFVGVAAARPEQYETLAQYARGAVDLITLRSSLAQTAQAN